jgi:putative nucleotidyltransferase with HDIG domain
MIALREQQHSPYYPTWRAAFHGDQPLDFYHLSPYSGENFMFINKIQEIKRKSSLRERTVDLIKWLAEHHELSARHCFGVAYIARELGRRYFSYYEDNNIDITPILNKIFIGGLLHDIGKVKIDEDLLEKKKSLTPNQKEKLNQHGVIGARILDELGLQDFAFFAEEHHIGNSQIRQWTKEQLQNRHPLTQIISMADLINSALDEARKYKKAKNIPKLIRIIHNKTKKGIFSPELEKTFLKLLKEEHPNLLLSSSSNKYASISDLLQTIP